MVILGTKCPSMTSTCTQSQPASSIARTSSPRRAKSADNMEGAIRIEPEDVGLVMTVPLYHASRVFISASQATIRRESQRAVDNLGKGWNLLLYQPCRRSFAMKNPSR